MAGAIRCWFCEAGLRRVFGWHRSLRDKITAGELSSDKAVAS